MENVNRINSIVFDLNQCIEDLGTELKLIINEFEKLQQNFQLIEKNSA